MKKKIIPILTAVAIALSAIPTVSANSTIVRRGDIDGNGYVNIADVLELLKFLAGMDGAIIKNGVINPRAFEAAKVISNSAKPQIGDVLEILKALSDMKSVFDVNPRDFTIDIPSSWGDNEYIKMAFSWFLEEDEEDYYSVFAAMSTDESRDFGVVMVYSMTYKALLANSKNNFKHDMTGLTISEAQKLYGGNIIDSFIEFVADGEFYRNATIGGKKAIKTSEDWNDGEFEVYWVFDDYGVYLLMGVYDGIDMLKTFRVV